MTTLFDRGEKIEVIPSSDDWNYAYIPKFTRGINTSVRADELEDAQLLIAEGVRPQKEMLIIDQGFKTFGAVVLGTPRFTLRFLRKTGTEHKLLFTTLTLYEWITAELQWQLVPTSVSSTTSGTEAAGQTVIAVADATGFVVNSPIGIILTDGQMHISTIASIASNDITIDDAIVAPGAASGAAVTQGDKTTMADTDNISVTMYPASDLLIYVNGVDEPRKYNGTIVADLAHNLGSAFTAKVVRTFNNHLIFLNTTEGGTKFPQRVRNTDTALPEELLTGNAGATDLYDEEHQIAAAELLGPYLIIYKTEVIYRMEFVGDVTRLFKFIDTVKGIGVRNPNAVTIISDAAHAIFSDDNLYQYNGGFDVKPLGDDVFDILFGHVSDINRSKMSNVFLVHVKELKEIWVFYPTGTATFPTKMIRIARRGGGWFTRGYSISVSGFGFFTFSGTTLRWTDKSGESWLDQQGSWIGNPDRADNPTVHLCGSNPNQVYEYDYVEPQDNGVDISYDIETKDFYIPNRILRFDRIDLTVKGSGIKLYYSIDKGRSFILLATLSPGAVPTNITVDRQAAGKQIRFKLTGSGDGFELHDLGFRYKRETIW